MVIQERPAVHAEDDTVIAVIDGAEIVKREFKLQANQLRSNVYDYFKKKYGAEDQKGFWETSFQGEVPNEILKERAFQKIKEITMEKLLAMQHKLVDDISYRFFLEMWYEENKARKHAAAQNEILYGPIQYDEMNYYNYFHSNLVIRLKETLAREQFDLSEANLRHHYETIKEDQFKRENTVHIKKIVDTVENNVIKLKEKIDAGRTFDDLYREHAETNDEDGEQTLGGIAIGNTRKMNDNLLLQAQQLRVGEVSEIFEVNGVFYLIQCTARQDNGYRPYEEVKNKVLQDYVDRAYRELIAAQVKSAKIDVMKQQYDALKLGGSQ